MSLAVVTGIIASVSAVTTVVLLVALGIMLVCRVPYAGTPPGQIERILDAIALPAGSRLYDLGCGDGRVVFAAARRGIQATGFELQPLTCLRAKWRQWRRCPQADIRWGNFRQANLTDADAVFCFLVAAVMPRVATWLAEHLRPGATVVSYGFPLPGWKTTTILDAPKPNGSRVYIYRPAPTPDPRPRKA